MSRLPNFLMAALILNFVPAWTTLARADEVKGTIRTVNAPNHEIVLKGVLKDTTYRLNNDVKVTLDGRRGTLTDLRAGDTATITFPNKDMVADEIRVLRKASETSGKILVIATAKREIVLHGLLRDSVYHLDKDAGVFLNGKEASFADLREGDEVTLTYEQVSDRFMVSEVRDTRK